MNFSLNKILSTSVVIGIAGLSFVLAISIQQSRQIENSAESVARTEELISRIQQFVLAILDNETGARGYVITAQEHFLEPLEQSEKDADSQLKLLAASMHDFPTLRSLYDSLKIYSDKRISFSKQLVQTRQEMGSSSAAALVLTGIGKSHTNNIRRITLKMQNEANKLLQHKKSINERNIHILNAVLYTTLIAGFLMCILVIKRIRSDTLRQKLSEEKFASLLDAAPDATVIVDEDGFIQMINKQVENLFGYSREELIGKPVEIMIPEALRPKYMHHRTGFIHKSALMPMGTGIELHAIKKSGMLFPVEISLSPIKTNDGLIVSASIRDITRRNQEKEQLESLIREINQSNNAIYTIDANRLIKTWNKGAENLYGFTFEEVVERDSNEILNTALSKEEINSILREIAEHDCWAGEVRRTTKTGREVFVRSSTNAIRNKEGKITGYVAMSFDITLQKKLRDQVNHLASIVQQSTEAIISLNTEHVIISWNNGAEKLYGYSTKEAIGKKIPALGITDLNDDDISGITEQLITIGYWKAEIIFYKKNSTSFFGALTANNITDESGNITAILFIIDDISVRKQLEEQLRRSNIEMEAFSYSVSHDLRAPLRAIVNYTTMLEEDYVNEINGEAKRITTVIKRNVARMEQLIYDLLEFSRTSKLEINKSLVNSQMMVDEIIKDFLQQNPNANKVVWDLKPLPPVNGDKSTLRQVWINLISNAIKYSGKIEQPIIGIDAITNENEIIFFVKDNGVGFDDKYKNKIFKVFQRLHKANEFEGTGVGLALVEKIIYRHGGRVWAEAKENEGACFYFSLPA